jgi:hypothetical protein
MFFSTMASTALVFRFLLVLGFLVDLEALPRISATEVLSRILAAASRTSKNTLYSAR